MKKVDLWGVGYHIYIYIYMLCLLEALLGITMNGRGLQVLFPVLDWPRVASLSHAQQRCHASKRVGPGGRAGWTLSTALSSDFLAMLAPGIWPNLRASV